jgi:hypothetical protein
MQATQNFILCYLARVLCINVPYYICPDHHIFNAEVFIYFLTLPPVILKTYYVLTSVILDLNPPHRSLWPKLNECI